MSTLGGDLIREARRRAGLTQAELAVLAGTSQSGIARWEAGRTAVSLDDAIRLVRLCGFDLEVMLLPRDDSDMAQATRLAGLPTRALVATRAAIDASQGLGFAEALGHEADLQRRFGAAHDYLEGVAAFMAKRPPRFSDR